MIDKDTLLEFHEKMMKRIEGERIFKREVEINPVKDKALSLVGPRRAGKTYAMLYYLKRNMNRAVYINLEHPCFKNPTHRDVIEAINAVAEYEEVEPSVLLLDEVQNVSEWEKVVRGLIDVGYYVVISGSSSKLLSKEIATQLRGRTLSYVLLPLSFKEFLRFNQVKIGKYISKDEEAKIKNLLRNYLEFGGFPDVVKNAEKVKILKEYSDLILLRDFIERHKIRNLDLARFLHNFMMQNYAKEISIRSLFNKIKTNIRVGKDTVYEYVTKLEDTMFFFFLKKFSRKVHLRELWPKKIYLCDTGLTKVVKYSQDYGRLMENAVFLDLLRKTNKNALMEVYYFRDSLGYEVDFVVKESTQVKELIQVTHAISFDEI